MQQNFIFHSQIIKDKSQIQKLDPNNLIPDEQ